MGELMSAIFQEVSLEFLKMLRMNEGRVRYLVGAKVFEALLRVKKVKNQQLETH